MSEIKDENQNPLTLIFKITQDGKIIEELNSIKSIPSFFQYLSNEKISQNEKINVILKFKEIIAKNRYIIEFFSEYDNKSIYLIFF